MPPVDHQKFNRVLVAVLAVVCFASAAAIWILDSWENLWCGSFVRAGLLLLAFWIALPTKGRAAAWADISPIWIVGFAGGLVFVVRRPRVLLPILAVLFVLSYLVPMLTRSRK